MPLVTGQPNSRHSKMTINPTIRLKPIDMGSQNVLVPLLSLLLYLIYFLLFSKSSLNLASSIQFPPSLTPSSIMIDLFTCMCLGPAGESLKVWFHDLSLYPSLYEHIKSSINYLTSKNLDLLGE